MAAIDQEAHRVRPRPPQVSGTRTPQEELAAAVKLLSARAVGPGEGVPAAFCWERGAGSPPSGVYRHSTGAQVMELSNTSARQPVALDYIVRELAANRAGRATVIHWLVDPGEPACEEDLAVAAPPRLFSGDSQESGHAPLTNLQVTELDALDEAVPPGCGSRSGADMAVDALLDDTAIALSRAIHAPVAFVPAFSRTRRTRPAAPRRWPC